MKATIPSLTAIFAIICIVLGITVKCSSLIAVAILPLLLVLPALCFQIHEMTPAAKRKHAKQMEQFHAALDCVDDLVELGKNKTEDNIAQFKRKWPNFDKQIILNDIMCKIASEKGVWELVNEISKTK